MIDRDGQRDGISKTKLMECGHPVALAVNSAESGEFLYCELCDAKSGRNDAEKMEALYSVRATAAEQREAGLREQVATLREALKPFAKSGELFKPRGPDDWDMIVYKPAAGLEYELCGDHLRAAVRALAATAPEPGEATLPDQGRRG